MHNTFNDPFMNAPHQTVDVMMAPRASTQFPGSTQNQPFGFPQYN